MRGVLLGIGVDLSTNKIHRSAQYLREYLPRTLVYNVEELRPIYREKYPDKVKKVVVPLSPARLQKAQSMRRLVLPKRGRRATHKKEHETIFRDLAFKKLQKLQQESTLII